MLMRFRSFIFYFMVLFTKRLIQHAFLRSDELIAVLVHVVLSIETTKRHGLNECDVTWERGLSDVNGYHCSFEIMNENGDRVGPESKWIFKIDGSFQQ